MNRRRFLAGVGSFAGAGSFILGTGAFTSVSAERSISVAVADDVRAFLRLDPLADDGLDGDNDSEVETTGRSFSNGNQIQFEIPGDEDGENKNAAGVGADSIYEFHDLLRIENHGTQSVEVSSEYNGDNFADLALVSDKGLIRGIQPTLGIGEGINVGLYINTHGTSTGEYEEHLTIIAERTGGDRD